MLSIHFDMHLAVKLPDQMVASNSLRVSCLAVTGEVSLWFYCAGAVGDTTRGLTLF